MRDIYKTAKQSQMAPVRGRVKAMMAQPRAVAQARKTARQTTGFKKGGTLIVEEIQSDVFPKVTTTTTKKKGKQAGGMTGFARGGLPEKKKHKLGPHIYTGTGPTFPRPPKEDIEGKKILKKQAGGTMTPMSGETKMTPMTHDSDFTRWFESQYGGTEKGKPHSTLEGRAAAGRRYMRRAEKYWTKRREEEKKRKDDPHHPREKKRMGPGAPAQPSPKAGPPAGRPKSPGGRQGLPKPKKEDPGMYVKKGGVVQKAFVGKLMEMFGRGKKATAYGDPANQGGPEPTHQQTMDVFKDKFAEKRKKGGVMEYQQGGLSKTREAGKRHWETKIIKLLDKENPTLVQVSDKELKALTEKAKKETPRGKGKEKGKEHRKKLLDLMRKASGYAEGFVTGKKKGGKVDKKWIQKAVNPKHKGYCTPMTKPTCTPARKRLAKLFKSKAKKGWKDGGLPYLTRGWSRPGVYKAPRGKHHMAELLAGKTSKLKMPKKASGKKLAAVAGVGAIGAETYRQKTKKKKKSVEESLIEKIKKKANGGTVVMPTVGNDVRTRAYKHGALIHPRPKPTTVAHGRGVGIAKRGW